MNSCLKKKNSMAGVLGLSIEKNTAAGTITLTQKGLIDIILRTMDLKDSNPNYTPTDKAHCDNQGRVLYRF